jgi:HAD superfamily hydrolase (TIGR01509 family)
MTAPTPGLRAILFDFMGVLLFPREGYIGDRTVDAVDGIIGGVVDDGAFQAAAMSGLKLDAEAFERALSHIPDKYEPFPPLWDLLPGLRKKFKLGIINNGTRLTFPYFDRQLHLTEQFDVILSSGAEGVRKPNPEIYLRACARLNVTPDQCLFMDDSTANIEGARQAGMQTVYWPDRDEGFRRFVEALNVGGMAV